MPATMNFVLSQSKPSFIPIFRVGTSRTDVLAEGQVAQIIQGSPRSMLHEGLDRDWLMLSEKSFAEDWDRPEDSVYDDL